MHAAQIHFAFDMLHTTAPGYKGWTLKNFMAPFFKDRGSAASRPQPLRGGSLLFTIQFPEIRGTHFIDLGRMKGWVDLGATQWFWARDPWIKERKAFGSVGISCFLDMIPSNFSLSCHLNFNLCYDVLSSFRLYYIQFKEAGIWKWVVCM